MDAASVHACRACTWVVCMPEGCVSTRRAATQPRSAAASHCAAAQRAETINRLGIPPISHTPRLRMTRHDGQGAIRIPLQAALLASITTCRHPRPRSLLETSCLSLEMAGQLQYYHSNGSPLTNPLELRAASLLTAFSQGVEETPGGGAAASIEFPSPAEVSGSAQGCREAARGSRGPKAYCLLGPQFHFLLTRI